MYEAIIKIPYFDIEFTMQQEFYFPDLQNFYLLSSCPYWKGVSQ